MAPVADILPHQSSLLCGDCCLTINGVQSPIQYGLAGCHCLALGEATIVCPPQTLISPLEKGEGIQGIRKSNICNGSLSFNNIFFFAYIEWWKGLFDHTFRSLKRDWWKVLGESMLIVTISSNMNLLVDYLTKF